ncbi:leader peptide processing enzyme [Marispirochaeta sp.]|uniref:leader peptide processing enzyme n=1 Tax=Marispirochaeta sp. TaxID=2038653 RepID=UPI0029C76E6B|nr:leader peptide processing enzyme [Marispirochaeta sp.]
MNKKTNTLLFVAGATVVNIILMFVFLIAGIVILSIVLPRDIHPGIAQGAFVLLFILSVIGSFLVYHRIMKILAAKIELDKYFEPIFPGRKKGR